MPYQALYRTYRPKTFKEVVGQKAIVRTLQNALLTGKIANAYLFCGPRGTGKTTMARLFAKALNCSEGRGNECNKCENCVAIMEGTHPDVYEIDAASNSGVDNVRALIDQVSFAPILGRYKVYIIDEVHSMSSSAFNALLKTLEEPPANVVFILATTEPEKVLPTILSRVQRYDFTKVSEADIVSKMKEILQAEKIAYEEDALYVIARLADGGVRDALSMLDQAISYAGGKITKADIDSLFGLLKVEDELKLVKMMHLNEVKEALTFVKDRYALGADLIRLHDDLTDIYKDLLVFGTTRDPSLLTYLKPEEALSVLATPSEIKHNLDILIDARREYRNASSVYDLFELTLLSLTLESKGETQPMPMPAASPAQSSSDTAASQPTDGIKPAEPKAAGKPEPASETASPKSYAGPAKPAAGTPEIPPAGPTLKTSALDRDDDRKSGENAGIISLSRNEVINIMVHGDKKMKNSLLPRWEEELRKIPRSDDKAFLADALLRSQPCIVCPEVIVVKSFFKAAVRTIDDSTNQARLQELASEAFGIKGQIIALSNSDYIDCVSVFMNLLQANSLPKPQPIRLPKPAGENKEKETNASLFFKSLGI